MQRYIFFLFLMSAAVTVSGGKELPPPVNTQPATFCRFVPERADDFAWENDLIAFRAYGPAICKSKGREDSGVDVWLKRVNYPILDRWYALDKQGFPYHRDFGEGNAPYHTGRSRGCGGTALWKDGKLILPGPYKDWKIISREPQKSVFELTYAYDLDGAKIQEIKRITIELGKRLFLSESTFTKEGKPVAGLEIAVGITTHDGKAKGTLNQAKGWISCWETIEKSGVGTGVVLAPSRVVEMRDLKSPVKDESHLLVVTRTDAEGKTVHYAGYGWQKAGEITTPEKWEACLDRFADALK